MSQLISGWRRVWVGLLPVGLLLAACTSAPSVSNPAAVAVPRSGLAALARFDEPDHHAHHAAPSDAAPAPLLTVNVYVTDGGIQPSSLFIPAGQQVELVMRNLGSTEHHYKVWGLAPKDPMRLAWEEPVEGAGDADHAHHHDGGLVPLDISTSSAGVRRTGAEVHAYTYAGGMDVIVFTATETGTFQVQCPLHPEMVGEVTVF